jgi:hypothetical protein
MTAFSPFRSGVPLQYRGAGLPRGYFFSVTPP